MKRLSRNPIKFDVFNAYALYGKEQKISISEPGFLDDFLTQAKAVIETASGNQRFIHGLHSQAMFEGLLASFGGFEIVKQEDAGEIYALNPEIQVPDFRVVRTDGLQLLIETKNFFQKPGREDFRLSVAYLDGLLRYADLMQCAIKIATYWVKWNQWSLVSPDAFDRSGSNALLSLRKALMLNEMSILGDLLVGTRFPLSIKVIANTKETRFVSEEGNVSFVIAGIELYCAGKLITKDIEKNIAWYIMLYGTWEEKRPLPILEDNQLVSVEFVYWPRDYEEQSLGYDEQGFALAGSLSEMFSSYYREATSKEALVHSLRAEIELGALGQLIPSDYKGEILPLWLLEQKRPTQIPP